MAKGWPGLTRVILKKLEPKSKPITLLLAFWINIDNKSRRPKERGTLYAPMWKVLILYRSLLMNIY